QSHGSAQRHLGKDRDQDEQGAEANEEISDISRNMRILQSSDSIFYAWMLLIIVWTVSSWRLKRTAQAEAWGPRAVHMVTMILAYLLLFDRNLRLGPLSRRFLPDIPLTTIIGVLCTWIGVLFAIWARVHIGQYWSARVTLKEDHKLIATGPYAYVRH